MCDITNQMNRPFITNNNIVLFYNDNIIENIIQFLIHFKKNSLKIARNFISICEGLYESLEYSEAKTITGLIVIVYFITLLTIHLFYSLAKKNNRIRLLEEQLQYIRNNQL
jgi:cbb3-type cytochrome oxidase subunit 1